MRNTVPTGKVRRRQTDFLDPLNSVKITTLVDTLGDRLGKADVRTFRITLRHFSTRRLKC